MVGVSGSEGWFKQQKAATGDAWNFILRSSELAWPAVVSGVVADRFYW
jgi:hypothetical protein